MMKFLFCMILMVSISTSVSGKYIIGAKSFSENVLLAFLVKQMAQEYGIPMEVDGDYTTQPARDALEAGKIHMYWEYTGTGYSQFVDEKNDAVKHDKEKLYNFVKKKDSEKGIVWLDPIYDINNTWVVVTSKSVSKRFEVTKISEMQRIVKANKFEGILSYSLREDGFYRLLEHYEITTEIPYKINARIRSYYKLESSDDIYLTIGFATDAKLAEGELVILEDDKHFFPVYTPSLTIRKKTLDKIPQLRQITKIIAKQVSYNDLTSMIKAVDSEHKPYLEVINSYLKSKS